MEAHTGYIIAAYAASIAIAAGLAVAVLRDHRAQAAKLAELESRSPRRRGER